MRRRHLKVPQKGRVATVLKQYKSHRGIRIEHNEYEEPDGNVVARMYEPEILDNRDRTL